MLGVSPSRLMIGQGRGQRQQSGPGWTQGPPRAAQLLALVLAAMLTPAVSAETYRIYLGTYTQGESRGIYLSQFSTETGELSEARLVGECKNPSFLAIHPSGKYVYAVSEIGDFDGGPTGAVRAFAVQDDGGLTALNAVPSSGQGPCHLVVDKAGQHVLVANYGSGSVSVVAIANDGRLGDRTGFSQHTGQGPNARRQEGPHAHSIRLDADNRYAFAADLGIDQLRIYRYDAATGQITPADPPFAALPPGGGPRHSAWHPTGKYLYVNNEMLSSVTAFAYDGAGRLESRQTLSTLPAGADVPGNSTAEIQVHPTGRYLYCSNRGHDSLVVMAIDEDTGKLTYVENESTGGRTPRNFLVTPDGGYVLAANQSTNNVVVLRVDLSTGELSPTGKQIQVPSPVCVKSM